MRQVHGDIRASLFRDFKDRIEEKEEAEDIDLMKDFHFNDSSMSITHIPTGNQIHSKGFRKSSSSRTAKMKSIAGATHIIIEEFEEVMEEDYMKLDDSLRTNKVENIQILRVWNPPPKDHWILKKYYTLIPSVEFPDYFNYIPNGKHSDHLHIFSTYHANIKNINDKKIRRWEEYKENERTKDHYITDILGLVSSGAKVTMIYGPGSEKPPHGVKLVSVKTAKEMLIMKKLMKIRVVSHVFKNIMLPMK